MNMNFNIWEIIKIGTFKSTNEFESIIENKCIINQCARNIMKSPNFSLSKVEMKINLVLITPKELNFEKFRYGAYYKDICSEANHYGLSLCPPEIGPQICLQSNKIQNDTPIVIAMTPIFIPSSEYPCLFHIKWKDDKNLISFYGGWGRSKSSWANSDKFIFCL